MAHANDTRARARRARRQRGTAMVEGTILVPVFITLYLGVVYLGTLHAARGQVRAEARRCAFQHAMNGCGRVPEGCNGSRTSDPEVEGAPDIVGSAATGVHDDLDPFQDIPVLGDAFRMLFGTTTASKVERQVPFPFDAELAGVASGKVVLLCNSQPTTVGDLAKERLCSVIDCGGGS